MAAAGVERTLTMSGYRSGTAIRDALKGDTLKEVMDKSYWRSGKTALHYVKLMEVLGYSGVKQGSIAKGMFTEAEYAKVNAMPLACTPLCKSGL
jgi:hypothetical protein